jgi:hypothetical protein
LLKLVYKESKIPYFLLLKATRLTTLEERRDSICLNFSKSNIYNSHTEDIFPDVYILSRPRLPSLTSSIIPTHSAILAFTERF